MGVAQAQRIIAWDFTGGGGTGSGNATWPAEIYDVNMDAASNTTRGAGAAASAGTNSFRTTGFQNNGISTANTDYFQITLSAKPGYTLSLTTVTGRFAGTAGYFASPGVTDQWAYSLDGSTFTLIGSSSQSVNTVRTWNFAGVSALQNVVDTTTITLRYYASGQTTTGGWGFNSSANDVYGLDISGTLSMPAAPEIAVSGNEQNIVDGDTTPATADHTDFGSVGLVGSTLTRTFTITNTGTSSLSLGNVTTTGTHAVDFVVTSQPSSPLAAGGTTTFSVQFDPSGVGTRVASLSFTNNDADENPFNFDIQGTGVAAAISNSPGTLNFTTTVGGNPAGQSFGLTNVGLGTLSYTIATNASWLSVSPVSGSLAGGAGATISVSIDSASLAAGSYNGTITVSDAAATNSPKSVSVSLTVNASVAAPSVSAPTAASIGTTSATLGGTIDSTNNASATERGVYWSTSSGFTPPGQGTVVNESGSFGNGAFTVAASGLPAGSAVYFKAYASNSAGSGYSSESSFFTVPQAPAIAAASSVAAYSFQANWGSATGATNYLVDVATDSGFASTVAGYASRLAGNAVSVSVTGLSPAVTYYYRVRTQAAGGTSTNSATQSTATLAATATVSTASISGIGTTSATGGGTVASDGGASVTARGVCWNTSGTPTTSDSTTSDGTGTGAFVSSLTGLTPGRTYYVRAYAINIAGTSYGAQVQFTADCPAGGPTGIHASSTGSTSFVATWDAFSGATSYALDVSTNPAFTVAGIPVTEVMTNVGGGTSSSYSTRQWTNQYAWTSTLTRIDQTVDGVAAITFQNAAGAYLTSQSIPGGLSELAIVHQLKFTGAATFDVFVNGTKVMTNVPYSSSVTTTRVTGLSFSGPFVLTVTNGTTGRVAIASVSWVGSGNSTYVSGYSNRAVAGTSQSVTGLAQGVTYYMRARGLSAYCTSANSTNGSVTTEVFMPFANFASASSSASEGDGTITVPVQVSFAADATVNVAVAGSSTAASGSDFTLPSTQVVFTAGGPTQQNLSISLIDDASVEAAETLVLTITDGPGVVPSGTTNHTVTIADNEPSVQFTYSSTNVSESAGSVVVTVYKSSTLNNVEGQIALSGTAADPGDYTLSGTNFTLNGATTSATITVTLTGDAVTELSETLTLTLQNLQGASTGATSVATLTIEDDDSPAINKGDIAIVGFHMDDPDDFAFVATTNLPAYAVIKFTDKGWDGGAITGNEGTVEWMAPAAGLPAGTVVVVSNLTTSGSMQTRGNFLLSTSGDQLLAYQGAEAAPTFIFGLNDRTNVWQSSVTSTADSMLPAGLTNGATALALVEFDNAAYVGPTTADRQALLSAICAPGNWSTNDTRGSIALPSGPFTITTPQPEMAVLGTNLVAITNTDAVASSADGTDFGSAAIIGATVDRTFTITNSGSAALTLSAPSISGTGASHFGVQGAPAGTVSASASTTFTLRFDPSAIGVHTALVSIANNDADENPYTFSVVGTGSAGPAVTFTSSTASASEGGSALTIPVQIASTYAATVQIAVAGGTATLSSDFTLSATQVVFTSGGPLTQSITLTVIDDASVEVAETAILQLTGLSGAVPGAATNLTVTIDDNEIVTPLTAGDLAVVGRQNSSGAFSILALTNLTPGQVVYFTDNGWSNTQFRNTANSARGNEDLIRLTINSNLTRGIMIRSTDTADARWTWTTSGAIPATNTGNFNILTLAQAGDQIYAFTAPTTNPLLNPQTHLFVLDSTGAFEPAANSNQGDIPPGLSSNADTAVSFAYAGSDILMLDTNKLLLTNLTTKSAWLAYIGKVANWTTNGTLASGSYSFEVACSAGIAPLLNATESVSVNAGSNIGFVAWANDPTCFAPSLAASNLPSGATFNITLSGTNRTGSFSWTPTAGQTGVHLVVIYASDGTLATQKTVRINVGATNEAWAGSLPSSLGSWTVPVTNLDAGSSGNATVQWVAAAGVIYNIYSMDGAPGAPGATWSLVGAVTGAGGAASFDMNGGTSQRFYQVVLRGDTPSTNGIWGVVRPGVSNGFNFIGAPLSSDRALDGDFGATLSAALTGDNNGVGTPPGDELHAMLPGGGWLSFYLDQSGVWRESGGSVATNVFDPGAGLLLLRYGAAVRPVFTGTVGNRGNETNAIVAGWNIVALSEGRALPIASTFDNTASGSPVGDYDESLSDLVVIHNSANGSWRRLQRLPTGLWLDLSTFQTATSLYLLPGQAVYYYRQSGDLNVKF